MCEPSLLAERGWDTEVVLADPVPGVPPRTVAQSVGHRCRTTTSAW